MKYGLSEDVLRANLLHKYFPEQRNIVTVGNNLLLFNHPKVRSKKKDPGPNCVVIQKGKSFIAPDSKEMIKWFIELMQNRMGWESNKVFREDQYLFVESIVPYKRIPVWNLESTGANQEYLDYMNEILNKFEWKNSIFHHSLRIDNSMTRFTQNAKENIDLFGFTVSLIAESSDLAELYNKRSGYLSIAGYFKREIIRDIFFKVIQGMYYDFYPVSHQGDFEGNIIYGHETWEYRPYKFSELIKTNPIMKGDGIAGYRKRIIDAWADKLYDWYFKQDWEGSEMSIFRIQKGIDYSLGIRSQNKTSVELFRRDLDS